MKHDKTKVRKVLVFFEVVFLGRSTNEDCRLVPKLAVKCLTSPLQPVNGIWQKYVLKKI